MKKLFYIIIMTLSLTAAAQNLTAPNGQIYHIQIEAAGRPPADGYPVLYVLDGDAQFPIAAAIARMQAYGQKNTEYSLLIVGIGYADTAIYNPSARARDYTPPADDYRDTGDKMNHEFGGAPVFRDFLQQTVKPAVAAQYAVNPAKQGIFGHSYGGLFALYALGQHPQDFSRYYISSPSIWWNKQRILAFMPQQRPPAGITAVISNGGYEIQPPPDADAREIAKLAERQMGKNGSTLATKLGAAYRVYPEQTHSSVMPHALADAVRDMAQSGD